MYNDTSENEARVRRNWNVLIFLAGTVLVFTVILFKLFSLQYLHYEENFQRSENNRLRRIELIADRGYIYDRNGNVLVRNRPSYQIALQALEMPRKKADRDSIFKKLLNIRDAAGVRLFDSLSLDTAFQRIRWVRTRPVRILEDATMEQVAVIEEHSTELPGVSVIIESRREYPYGTLASHVLGYTSEISEEQLKLPEYASYSQGDRVGQKGLEQEYDKEFRGKNGLKLVEVNASGREVRTLSDVGGLIEPEPGLHMISTIDLKLQKVAEAAIPDSAKGALVAIESIRAMVKSWLWFRLRDWTRIFFLLKSVNATRGGLMWLWIRCDRSRTARFRAFIRRLRFLSS